MLKLKPVSEISPAECPECHSRMPPLTCLITGMRNLVEFACSDCGTEYYGDVPAGQALYTPILLEKKSGKVFDSFQVGWFSEWLALAYKNRNADPIPFETRQFSRLEDKVIVLNCLDTLYGHSLLKLLNAQYYLDHHPDKSLILLLPRFLEWMLPDGVAEAWIVDLPLRRGTEWNDWLAVTIARKLADFPELYLSAAFSHPHPDDVDIERYTRTQPLPLENLRRHENRPVVTFIWRSDRLWEGVESSDSTTIDRLKRGLGITRAEIRSQAQSVIDLAEKLRLRFPELDFAVAGLGDKGGFPEWINDLRVTKFNEAIEREMCERYAKSHIVIGVHGSNMLLPSAHAGSVIELLDKDRFGNYLQDILFRASDPRDMFFRYRFIANSASASEVADLAAILLRYDDFQKLMGPRHSRHRANYDFHELLTYNGYSPKPEGL